MNELKHTPGPWLYRPNRTDDWGIVRSGFNHVICQARDPRFVSEEALTEARNNGKDPWDANALLIAAAPELLKALMDSTDELDGLTAMFADNEHLVNVLDRYVKRNRAVIAKAIGGQL